MEVTMHKRRYLGLAAGLLVVGCFEQTESISATGIELRVKIDLGTFDGGCDTPSGDVVYTREGDLCHVAINKNPIDFFNMDVVRAELQKHANLSGATIHFYDPAAPLTAVTFLDVIAENGAGTNVTPDLVPKWNASFNMFGKELPPDGFSGMSSTGKELNTKVYAVSLDENILAKMDDAYAAMKPVPASFHADIYVTFADAAALGREDHFVIDFKILLDVNGTITTGL
jgi:hypothetical protein